MHGRQIVHAASRLAAMSSAQSSQGFWCIDIGENGVIFDRHLADSLGIQTDKMTRAHIPLEPPKLGEQLSGPRHRITALAVADENRDERASSRLDRGSEAINYGARHSWHVAE